MSNRLTNYDNLTPRMQSKVLRALERHFLQVDDAHDRATDLAEAEEATYADMAWEFACADAYTVARWYLHQGISSNRGNPHADLR